MNIFQIIVEQNWIMARIFNVFSGLTSTLTKPWFITLTYKIPSSIIASIFFLVNRFHLHCLASSLDFRKRGRHSSLQRKEKARLMWTPNPRIKGRACGHQKEQGRHHHQRIISMYFCLCLVSISVTTTNFLIVGYNKKKTVRTINGPRYTIWMLYIP